jgi:hypothetical protein
MNSTLRVVLGLIALFSAIAWIGALVFGTSAIHQILTGVYALIFTVAMAALGLDQALRNVADRLPRPRPPAPPAKA